LEGGQSEAREEREQLQHQGQRRRTEPALSEAEGSVRPTRARNVPILTVGSQDSSRTEWRRLSVYIRTRAVPFGTLSCFRSFPGTSVPGYCMPPLTGLGACWDSSAARLKRGLLDRSQNSTSPLSDFPTFYFPTSRKGGEKWGTRLCPHIPRSCKNSYLNRWLRRHVGGPSARKGRGLLDDRTWGSIPGARTRTTARTRTRTTATAADRACPERSRRECPPHTSRVTLLAGGARLRGRGSIWNFCGGGLGGCRVGGWWRPGGGCTRRRRGLRRRR